MSLIKESKILNWVQNSPKKEFSAIDLKTATYFEDSSIKNEGIEVYDFNNIPELVDMLNRHITIKDFDLTQICAVEAFGNKPRITEGGGMASTDNNIEIPDFVYVF